MNSITKVLMSFLLAGLNACASKDNPCEEILEVKRQVQQCEQWRKVMNNNNYPQQAMTAKKRYEQECQDLRYYRDDYDTICKGNETPIGKSKTEH
ncbi:hypothetical protein [Paraglaciecola hydrolytica]|uniref:Uncharacterized protein n=1 Tax=Paraglaciecola hydrolytica TaxID=1799789 RepID=A0A136A682_9ALTE|nr:hypothetical protein [Paraglaciecola hydrolytica]KXI30739.1 hypothetical protein AX660_04780 [Paraglaciecola hydrolytica]